MMGLGEHKKLDNLLTKNVSEAGNILFASLLVMLSMNLMVVGLMQFSVKENKQANIKTTDSTNFYLNETCIEEMADWLRSQASAPEADDLPYSINRNNIDHLLSGAEDSESQSQLSRYSYNCTIDYLTIKSVQGQEVGVGSNVVVSDAYGASGDLSPTYFYNVVATANGPSNYIKVTNAIISMKF